ncbi:MAG: hypothetical protein COW24_00130 [Candidatus Kerfeldbacteria bacterium CG15_BIG_FIL_POST_REV_8_21_14_020_45_12]|uniref:Uncharacterized protein n=1 Tax=Candidatus Kerfeldbacteria bacterium CG15_BIG_FIL_POST_REV_8_21_14_020_45_12 TaxID=2014247 RepID=A0A2M7H5C7_9BACT|nr:MAG: hypothetical protein COW24_00130 [Candidatus Kerfeldbacteria bacterium CG15_BIG_FIL_POST_REV_8_21_14_020_45_12]PJA92902.1 MAG: hypothetical protein CO132_05925 [Candidatus Kerfeldbacteria bacterium CG_4_9_14_3_um_filter_45_8]
METSPNKQPPIARERRHTGIIILIILLVLMLGMASYAFYAANESSMEPDISEGDIVDDLPTLTGVPYSGQWTIKLEIGNTGPATLIVAPGGASISLFADGKTVYFYNTSSALPYTYKSNIYPFEIQNPDGSTRNGNSHFEFTAVDSDVIDGIVYHDTDVLGEAEVPFHMELVEIELPDNPWYLLPSGDWNISYSEAGSECEDGSVSFSSLPSEINVDYAIDTDVEQASGEMTIDFGGDIVSLSPTESENFYSQTSGNINPGMPTDSTTNDLLLDYEDDTFTTEVSAYGTPEGTMEGSMTITSSGGCSFNFGFTASPVVAPSV